MLLAVALVSCDSERFHTPTPFEASVSYYHDERTNLCFVYGLVYGGVSVATVPCSESVLRISQRVAP